MSQDFISNCTKVGHCFITTSHTQLTLFFMLQIWARSSIPTTHIVDSLFYSIVYRSFKNRLFVVRVRGFGSPPTRTNEDTLFLLRMSNKPHTNFKRQNLSDLDTDASTFQVMNLLTYIYTDLYMLMPNINSCIIKEGIFKVSRVQT